jgi:hypothetical protein
MNRLCKNCNRLCKNCGDPIARTTFGWVHLVPGLARCHDDRSADGWREANPNGLLAEPYPPLTLTPDEVRRIAASAGFALSDDTRANLNARADHATRLGQKVIFE